GQERQRQGRALHQPARGKGRAALVGTGRRCDQAAGDVRAVHAGARAAAGDRRAGRRQARVALLRAAIQQGGEQGQFLQFFFGKGEPRAQFVVQAIFSRQRLRHVQKRARGRQPQRTRVLGGDRCEQGQRRVRVGAPD